MAGPIELTTADFLEIKQALIEHGAFGAHHIGTTRIGKCEVTGVVDKNLRVFGYENIYALSSAAFPQASHANPTFTVVALAVRLADYLSEKNENTY